MNGQEVAILDILKQKQNFDIRQIEAEKFFN